MKHITFLLIAIILLSGCASTPRVATIEPLPRPSGEGVYHRVSRGQTLWRIAKAYNVDIGRIAVANRLRDPSKIETGQMLFVPTAKIRKKVVPVVTTGKISKKGFMWPIKGKIASYFGQKAHETINNGIDIIALDGSRVVASKDGIVSFADDQVKGFGKTIIIDHHDGYKTVYAYNSLNLVNAGTKVRRGQEIARIGKNTRSNKFMLHFEIRYKEKPKNPFYFLP